MPNPKLATPAQRLATKRRRALKKQLRRRVKRRAKIMAELVDPFTATLLESSDPALDGGDERHAPMMLLPARALRRRVAELNRQGEDLYLDAPPPLSPEAYSRPDPALMDGAGLDGDGAEVPEPGDIINDCPGGTDPIVDLAAPAPRPRRRGRLPADAVLPPFPLLPFMPDQSASLRVLLNLCAIGGSAAPGLGRRHPCPCCCSPAAVAAGVDPRPLTVLPTAAGDLVFRCHRGGFCLDSVEFLQRARPDVYPTIAEAARAMADGLLAAPLPPAHLAGYERLARLRTLFERGRERFRGALPPRGAVHPILFGDWALLDHRELWRVFPDRLASQGTAATYHGRLGRDRFGRPRALDLHGTRSGERIYRLDLRDWEPAATSAPTPTGPLLFTPRWADYLEWGRLIVCTTNPLARVLESALARWPDAERLPLALLDRGMDGGSASGAIVMEPGLPFAEVWLALRGETECADAGLPFCGLDSLAIDAMTTTVRVRRLPSAPVSHFQGERYVQVEDRLVDHPRLASRAAFCEVASAPECVADVAATLAREGEHQPLALAVAGVLHRRPGLHPTIPQRLIEEVGQRVGRPPDELLEHVGTAADAHAGRDPCYPGGPYALNAPGGTTYVRQAGRYWRRGRREKGWTPVSNFCLRLVGRADVDARGRVTHRARLEIGAHPVALTVSLSSAVLDSAKRLQTALTRAAASAGAALPFLSDPKAKRLLPELVKATCPMPPPRPRTCSPRAGQSC